MDGSPCEASCPLNEQDDVVAKDRTHLRDIGTEENEDDSSSLQWFNKLKQNDIYRYKFTLSLALCWSFVCLGWHVGQFGPSFLDLRIITNNTPLEKATFFMTSGAVGYLFGSLVTGVIFDRSNKILFVSLTVFANIFLTAVIPWCIFYELMITILFLRGAFAGGLDVGGNALLVSTWGKDQDGRSFMQALHFAFAIGGIISPLATAPFLMENEELMPTEENTNTTSNGITTNFATMEDNVTFTSGMFYNSSNVTGNLTTSFYVQHPESRLFVAFLISAVMNVTAAVALIIVYLQSKNDQKHQNENKHVIQTTISTRELPIITKIFLLISACFFLGLYCAIEDTFISLLATFCVKQMHWSKIDAAIASSVFWTAFGFGRFLGIFLVKVFKPTKLIIVYSLFLALTFVGLFFTSTYAFDVGIWICCIGAGLGMSIVFPCVFTWTEENLMPVTGKVASAFLISSSCGSMINPIFLGYLMDLFTPMWFSYLLLIESICLFLLFNLLLMLARVIKNRYGDLYVVSKVDIQVDDYNVEPTEQDNFVELKKMDCVNN